MKTEVICTLNRAFLDEAGANLWTLQFAFAEQLVDKTFEREGKTYCVSSVDVAGDKIVATYFERQQS